MTPVNAPTPTGNTDTEAQEHPVAAVFWLLVAGLLGSVAALFAISLFHGSFARVASGLLGSLSGALLGAGISFYIRRWLTHDPAVGMREILDHALTDTGHLVETILAKDARMVSKDIGKLSAVDDLRIVWHHYHLTLTKSGLAEWRYCILDFGKDRTPGSLKTSFSVEDPFPGGGTSAKALEYQAEGALWGNRLILSEVPERGVEEPTISVFPGWNHGRKAHAGVAIVRSWANSDVLAPIILSKEPIEGLIDDLAATAAQWPRRPDGGLEPLALGTIPPPAAKCLGLWHLEALRDCLVIMKGFSETKARGVK